MTLLAAVLAVAAGAATASEPPPAAIRLDQVTLDAAGGQIAIVATTDRRSRPWVLRDRSGTVLARGETRPFGWNAASGELIQRVEFGGMRTVGDGFRLTIGEQQSHLFAIGDGDYRPLADAALGFFYQQRSGVPIDRAYVERDDLARTAGHPDERVTCFDRRDERGVRWPGCDYRLTTTGGWYDAGDQGKYVVNGGIAAWTLLDLHARLAAWRAPDRFADGMLPLPESGNGVDDLLDEARVEVEFLLAMQVPPGGRVAVPGATGTPMIVDAGGMAHTKVADVAWTPLPTAPVDDRMQRFLYPPSTAATLNLAAVGARAARAWRTVDPAFAARALAAATRAWDAATRHPRVLASSAFTGSGGYGDEDLTDERFWAAAELLATTGDERYRRVVAAARCLHQPSRDLSWGQTDLAGLATLATDHGLVPPAIANAAATALIGVADGYLHERERSGYRVPAATADYPWGSNGWLLNRALVLGVAFQLTGQSDYRTATADVIAYLRGRNPLDRSFVTGFGQRTMHQPHHRFWAHAADQRYPQPPRGVVSGGPNSTAMTDPVAVRMKGGCVGQTCWVDDWRAFTMNEVAINWNAPLVWVATFLDVTSSTREGVRSRAAIRTLSNDE